MRGGFTVVLVVCLLVTTPTAGAVVNGQVQFGPDLRTLSYGDTASGRVDAADPTRDNPRGNDNAHTGTWYYEPVTFTGSAGDLVRIDLQSSGTDTVVVLVAPDGTTVSVNEDGGDGNDSLVLHRLQQDGEYTVQVTSHYPNTTFDYSLSLSKLTVPYESDPGSIEDGESIAGRIDDTDPLSERFNGHYENITFQGGANQSATLRMLSSTDSELRLYGPGGDLVASEIEDASGRNTELVTQLPTDGEYTAVASSNGHSTPFTFLVSLSGARDTGGSDGGSEGNEDSGGVDPDVPAGDDPGNSGNQATDGTSGGGFAAFDVVSLSMNRSSAYPGEPVRVSAEVENYGTIGDTFDALLNRDRTLVTSKDRYVPPGETRNLTFRLAVDETDTYQLFLRSNHVGELTVQERPDPALDTTTSETAVRGTATHAREGTTLTMGLPETNRTADFERLNLTFAQETRRMTVQANETRSLPAAATNNTTVPSLPTGIQPATYFHVEAENETRTEQLAGAGLTFAVDASAVEESPSDVVLYHYDSDEGAVWSPIQASAVNTSGETYRYRAPIDTFSMYAVGIQEPVFDVSVVTLSDRTPVAGSEVTASAIVRNRGAREGTLTVPFAVDNRTVESRNVTLGAGGSTAVSFARPFTDPGTYQVQVGDSSQTVVIQETPTPTATQTLTDMPATTTPASTAEPAQDANGTEATPASGPGFGPLLALLAVLVGLVTAIGVRRA